MNGFVALGSRFPPGESDHEIPGLGFDVTAHVKTMELPDSPTIGFTR